MHKRTIDQLLSSSKNHRHLQTAKVDRLNSERDWIIMLGTEFIWALLIQKEPTLIRDGSRNFKSELINLESKTDSS